MYGRDPWGGSLEIAADSGTDDDRSRNLQDIDRAPPPDNYTLALRKALMFFNAQKSGKLPKHNNVSWRGNSALNDGKSDPSSISKNLVGGYYDAGDAIKFNFPQSFAMTMLSWSVIEYSAKYEAAGELSHIKDVIKWGTDYFLKTFNSSADTIDRLVMQVGNGDTIGGPSPNDHYCWMRPEDIDYERPVTECHSCSDLAAEMAAALASASIVLFSRTTRLTPRNLSMELKPSLNSLGISVAGIA